MIIELGKVSCETKGADPALVEGSDFTKRS